MLSNRILTFLAVAFYASAIPSSPLEARDVIGHDKVVGFDERVPEGEIGNAMLRFKPFLKVSAP